MKKILLLLALCCCMNIASAKKIYCTLCSAQRGYTFTSQIDFHISGEYPQEIENIDAEDPTIVINALARYGYSVEHYATGDVGGNRVWHYFILSKEVAEDFKEYSYRKHTFK